METRAADETDLQAIAELLELPEAATVRLLQTRSVVIAVEDGQVTGCLSYDVHEGVIEVTRIAGPAGTVRHLLDVPRQRARSDERPIEVLLPEADQDTARTLEEAGFEKAGRGPRFRGRATTRFRWEPSEY